MQVDPDVFAALPKELQEELKSAYSRALSIQPQAKIGESTGEFLFFHRPAFSFNPMFVLSAVEQKNPLLQLKQCGVGIGVGRVKRRYKRKNAISPLKKGTSPMKRRPMANSPAKAVPPPIRSQEPTNVPKVDFSFNSCSLKIERYSSDTLP